MIQFLKNNPTIAFGIGLPLVVVIILSVAAIVPDFLYAPPQYSVVYATNYYESKDHGLMISVKDKKIRVSYIDNCSTESAKLYIYNPIQNISREIKIELPNLHPKSFNSRDCSPPNIAIPIAVPELESLTVDASDTAPDGYQLSYNNNYSGGLVTGIFFSHNYYSNIALERNGHRVRLPHTDNYYGNGKLIGWVIP